MSSKYQTIDDIGLEVSPSSDKTSIGHGYTAIYERYLKHLRQRPVRILEIGVWEGASLRMWSRSFPLATVIGADLDITRCRYSPPDSLLVQCDQSDINSLTELGHKHGPFDVVIDDGSHLPEHQILTFDGLWPFLSPGGHFFVEDLQVNYHLDRPMMVNHLGINLQKELHGRGLSAQAIPSAIERSKLSNRERQIEYIHLYRYIAVVKRRLKDL